MAASLLDSRATAERREQHIHDQSARLRSVLRMVREIGGSLNLKYVLESVVAASRPSRAPNAAKYGRTTTGTPAENEDAAPWRYR